MTTVYTVTGSNGTCPANKTATIVITPNPTVSVSNQTICPGGTATITASGANTYSWSTSFTGNPLMVTPGSTTTYTVIGTTTGCTNTKTVSVTVGTSLSVLINTNPSSKCASGSATLTASGATNYTWTPGGSNAVSIVVNQTTTTNYTVVGTNGACSGFATTTVNVIPTPTFAIVTSPSNTICAGKTVTMTASGFYSSYTWVTPTVTAASYTATPGSTTSYTVSAFGTGGCNTTSVVTINVNSNPVTALSSTNANCTNPCSGIANGVTTLGTGPYTYSLTGSTCTTLPCSNLCAGNYTLVTNDNAGCTTANTFSIVAPTNNILVSASSTIASCPSCSNGIASVNVTGGVGPYTYTWSPIGGNSATANNLPVGCYTVTVKDGAGCSASTSTCVTFGVGINNMQIVNSSLLVYPNPAQSIVTIEFQGVTFNYVLYNNLGQVVAANQNNQNKTFININEFAKGIYLVEIEIGKDKIRKKLIIE